MFGIRRPGPPVILFATFIAVLFLYSATVADLYVLWVSSGSTIYSHGALLMPVAAYLFYSRWRTLDFGRSHASALGALSVAALSFLWFLAGLGGVAAVQYALFVGLFPALIWAIFGWRTMQCLVFPFVLLLCAIPIWEVINEGTLQLLNTALVERLLELTGISVYREGITLNLSNGAFKVAENCSGMRQLVVAIPIALIYAHLNQFKVATMTVYAATAALLSVLVNVVRIYIVVVSGYLTDMQHYFVREDHITLGWVLFGAAILLFLLGSNRVFLKQGQEPAPMNTAGAIAPFAIRRGAVAGIAGLLLAPVLVLIYTQRAEPLIDTTGMTPPAAIGNWSGHLQVEPDYVPAYQQGDVVRHAAYTNPAGETVAAYVSYFASQRQDHEAVSTMNKLADGVQWHSGLTQQFGVKIDGLDFRVREAVVRGSDGREKVVWQWYYALGRHTASNAWAKVLGTVGDLLHQRDVTVIALSTDVGTSLERSRDRLTDFAGAALPQLVDMIRSLETE
jgi:EpsI family protein